MVYAVAAASGGIAEVHCPELPALHGPPFVDPAPETLSDGTPKAPPGFDAYETIN